MIAHGTGVCPRVSVVVEDQNKKQEKITAENVLVAVGRAPNVEGLDLNKANVEYSSKGIKVNEYLQTTNPNIFEDPEKYLIT